MALVTENTSIGFDLSTIKRGDFVRFKYTTSDKALNGIVATVTPKRMTVFFIPETTNVSNYVVIDINDRERWELIKWSSDLEAIGTYPEEADE